MVRALSESSGQDGRTVFHLQVVAQSCPGAGDGQCRALPCTSTHPSLHNSVAVSSSLAQAATAQLACLLTSTLSERKSSTRGSKPPAFLNYNTENQNLMNETSQLLSSPLLKSFKLCKIVLESVRSDIHSIRQR